MLYREVFVVLPKHPLTAPYIRVPSLPCCNRPPTHTVLKHTQETVIKLFPQVIQIRLVKPVNYRNETLLIAVQQTPASSHWPPPPRLILFVGFMYRLRCIHHLVVFHAYVPCVLAHIPMLVLVAIKGILMIKKKQNNKQSSLQSLKCLCFSNTGLH